MTNYDAIIIGAGPNGLAAAVELARSRRSVCIYEANPTIGGGTRSAELTLPGFIHDVCSSVYPLAAGSPFFSKLPLHKYGLDFVYPPAALAHPFDDGTAVVVHRSVEVTSESLGRDRSAYRKLFKPVVERWHEIAADFLGPPRLPRHPLTAASFGVRAIRSAKGLAESTWALSAPVPWTARECCAAATVHLGGSFAEILLSEHLASKGKCAEKPFVILSQPTLFDRSRAPAGQHTLWAYCHVPNGSVVDMTDRIENQIERFAPGFRDCILARSVMAPADLESHNANLVGGDINGGYQGLSQMFLRPTFRLYSTPAEGLYICSSSTPPGGGVHGLCGYYAAQIALRKSLR